MISRATWRLILALLLLLPVPALAQPAGGTPIAIGQTYKLPSKVMGAERALNIWLPPGYATSGKNYPVLYLLDGGLEQDFQHIAGLAQLGTVVDTIQPMIVVGIETVDRRNELAFPTSNAKDRATWPTAGHSERFRRYLSSEVLPWVETNFRTTGDTVLMGESLAGLFVVDTLLKQPDLFRRYIAISPSLWWDDMSLVKAVGPVIAYVPGERWLWLALADEGAAMGVDPLVAALKSSAPAGLHWSFTPMPAETHATIYHPAALAALRALFGPPSESK
ncbi:alpha/beta hydrolase-fold protein [Sphingomonas sp. AOB5]|uniref:alpha/beta hydrolase n=1 Tax=Sphingomonas sp. AOB5 TaxID=3034017 RepID=UPI0023F6559B|nr:alpha/beta hydrolase-fold protein [Sphingomonas sp. AOB5]MDF7774924.1 alpha/beta hydrolase-fold protein [Sphingomonas sp. AOB5]